MTTPAEAQSMAQKHKGTWCPLSQDTILKIAAQAKVPGAVRAGVCWEVCRRWVKARVEKTWIKEDTILDILSPVVDNFDLDKEKMEELIATHAARVNAADAENYKIDGLTNHKTLYRTYSCFGAGGLKSRKAVLKAIFETRGAYIFSVLEKNGGGHAIAFDTTPEGANAIMDPNTGEGIFPTPQDFKSFFIAFYGDFYKQEYTKGERELTRYTKGGPAI